MSRQKTLSDFINEAQQIHFDRYNYSKVNYEHCNKKVCIICKEHGEFWQTPHCHLISKGCSKCKGKKQSLERRSTKDEFINKAKQIHNNLYDYILVNYINAETAVQIICKEHGIFKQTPHSHLRNHGCPNCKLSKGELFINKYLTKNSIEFISQKRFKDCRDIRPLPFDFYLPKVNTCIEYDGQQHFGKGQGWGFKFDFETIKRKDDIKTNYCKVNDIRLIRIPYTIKLTEKYLKSILSCHDIIYNIEPTENTLHDCPQYRMMY